jgi:hypothetical protein
MIRPVEDESAHCQASVRTCWGHASVFQRLQLAPRKRSMRVEYTVHTYEQHSERASAARTCLQFLRSKAEVERSDQTRARYEPYKISDTIVT